MKVHLVSFSSDYFKKSHAILNKTALKNGVDNIFHYTLNGLKESEFYKDNNAIFSFEQGVGFWLWKPYYIAETLKVIADDDIIVYSDAGVEIIKNLKPLIDLCHNKEDILLFQGHNMTNAQYTKRDAFVLMDCDAPHFYNAQPIQASFMLFKKTSKSVGFVNEWLNYCLDINIISDLPNICQKENLGEYIDHRKDQSVLSLLQVKHNIKVYRNPSQMGLPYIAEYPDSSFPQIINHHWGRPDGRFAGPLRRFLLLFGIWRY